MAKFVAEDQNPCFSRQIGSVIVDPDANRVMSTGYNGPPRGTPHTNTVEYLREFLWPHLSQKDKWELMNSCDVANLKNEWVNHYINCKTCPRKLLGIPSGQRPELCSCEHSERNAIFNAGCDLKGCYIFCWCGIPCQDCTKAICNSQLSKVYCLASDLPDYSPGSRWIFKNSGVKIIELDKDWILSDQS